MKKLIVKADTKLSDLKVGDIVITAELHRIVEIVPPYQNKYCHTKAMLLVSDVRPQCKLCGPECEHIRVMEVGWGQQCVAKVLPSKAKYLS